VAQVDGEDMRWGEGLR